MTNRHAYMRQWQRRRRWRGQVETALARLEILLAAQPDDVTLPPLPESVRAAWDCETAHAKQNDERP